MAHVRSARPRKLGGAFLKIEILQFGMGIEPPQISLLGRVYVNAPAPRLPTRSNVNRQGTFAPSPTGMGRLSLAGLLRTRRRACWRRPKEPFIGPSILFGPELH